ncbi:MAG TPA: DUF192 domain-containing protein [Patescibacteria group bacterium]|nr:DUF192 domain-containing protein [Patescibacteria group bacterium]
MNYLKKLAKIIGLFLALAMAVAVIIFGYYFIQALRQQNLKAEVMIKNQQYQVEMVKTPIKMAEGLSGRNELATNSGMLFVYDDKQKRDFWMNKMNFDLDIIFIDDSRVVDFVTLKKPESSNKIPKYTNLKPANFVLEIPAGEAKKLGLKIGDMVEINQSQ